MVGGLTLPQLLLYGVSAITATLVLTKERKKANIGLLMLAAPNCKRKLHQPRDSGEAISWVVNTLIHAFSSSGCMDLWTLGIIVPGICLWLNPEFASHSQSLFYSTQFSKWRLFYALIGSSGAVPYDSGLANYGIICVPKYGKMTFGCAKPLSFISWHFPLLFLVAVSWFCLNHT